MATSQSHDAPPLEETHVTLIFSLLPTGKPGWCSEEQKVKLANYTKFFKLFLSVAPIEGNCKRGNPVAPFHCVPGLRVALYLALTGRLVVWGTHYPGRRGVPLALGYDLMPLQGISVPCLRGGLC